MFKNKFNYSDMPSEYTITYHAGFMDTKDNSLESVIKAIKMGARVVEFDVTFRRDLTPVLMHSAMAGDNEGVLLEDAIKEVAKNDYTRINLDIKSVANLPKVEEIVREYGIFDRCFCTGIAKNWVEDVKKTNLPYFLNYNVKKDDVKSAESIMKLADEIINCGAMGLNSNYLFATPKLVEIMHKKGIPVSLWTCNTKRAMKKALLTYPDNITTRQPVKLEDLIRYSK